MVIFYYKGSLVCDEQSNYINVYTKPILVAASPKAWFFGHSLAGIVGSNPAGGMDVSLL
jgi:hypothetical protein